MRPIGRSSRLVRIVLGSELEFKNSKYQAGFRSAHRRQSAIAAFIGMLNIFVRMIHRAVDLFYATKVQGFPRPCSGPPSKMSQIILNRLNSFLILFNCGRNGSLVLTIPNVFGYRHYAVVVSRGASRKVKTAFESGLGANDTGINIFCELWGKAGWI